MTGPRWARARPYAESLIRGRGIDDFRLILPRSRSKMSTKRTESRLPSFLVTWAVPSATTHVAFLGQSMDLASELVVSVVLDVGLFPLRNSPRRRDSVRPDSTTLRRPQAVGRFLTCRWFPSRSR